MKEKISDWRRLSPEELTQIVELLLEKLEIDAYEESGYGYVAFSLEPKDKET